MTRRSDRDREGRSRTVSAMVKIASVGSDAQG